MRVVDGELRVKAPQVMQGYVDERLNEEAFDSEGWLRTGDLGNVDEDGNVYILGRSKDVVIRKGETLSAKAIEDDVVLHPRIVEVAVIGVPHLEYGEIACAVIVLRDPSVPLTLTDLTGFLAEQDVPKRRWPERLEVVATLPRSPAGKVQKGELRTELGF
jgi:non-ribosomal peptide synthetase component E (peptide arylation enzyme)